MYNYQQFQHQQKVVNHFKETYQQFLKESKHRKTLTELMTKKHNKRVETFMFSAIDDPIQINQYKPPHYNPRAFLSMNKPVKSFRMNFHNTQQRLQQIIHKNSYLDCVPFHNSSLHKFREPGQSIHKKAFRIKIQSSIPQLKDSRMSSVHQTQNQIKKREIFKHYSNLHKQKDKKLKRELNKTLAQTRKAYFNSLKSVLIQNSTANLREDDNQTQSSHKYDSERDKQVNKRNFKIKMKPISEMDRKTKAILALTNCGLIKPNCLMLRS